MRIVSYNVNGLRPRVAQHRTLATFLDSLDAHIICIQETKLRRSELTSDIAIAEGYESFFSCTRTSAKGRIGYSGVATFCRTDAATLSTSSILPIAADEGFTGLLHLSKEGKIEGGSMRVGCYEEVLKIDSLTRHELLGLDSEGRCLITDHGCFVLFNIYGPCISTEGTERTQFKLNFFQALQCRLEALLKNGRRVIVVGDLNIAPFAIDSCNRDENFDSNVHQKWLRSLLKDGGGTFFDLFRVIHPNRTEAYTCWSKASGAKKFNFGRRIDLILAAGPCIDQVSGTIARTDTTHGFVQCEVQDCDILTDFKQWKIDSFPRWSGGRNLKLDGSDHVPVYVLLKEQPPVPLHHIPSLAARFFPGLRGKQQKLVSLFQKRLHNEKEAKASPSNGVVAVTPSSPLLSRQEGSKEVHQTCLVNELSDIHVERTQHHLNQCSFDNDNDDDDGFARRDITRGFLKQARSNQKEYLKQSLGLNIHRKAIEKKPKLEHGTRGSMNKSSQSSLHAFFNKNAMKPAISADCKLQGISSDALFKEGLLGAFDLSSSPEEIDVESQLCFLNGKDGKQDSNEEGNVLNQQYTCILVEESSEHPKAVSYMHSLSQTTERGKKPSKVATLEWKRILGQMSESVPICQGHGEPCVWRAVKKAGPNIGRGFYVCARAQGPSSNPDAQCGHFEWAASKKKAAL